MGTFFTCITSASRTSHPSTVSYSLLISVIILSLSSFIVPILSQKTQCRTACGSVPISYPFGIDDGCGSPYYRHLLLCRETGTLELWTPSGRYPVVNISYSDPHLIVTDPFMWNCQDMDDFRPTRAFSLDTSVHLSLSPQNEYLFFNCSERDVIVEPRPIFCERFPEKCDSSCDSSSYLCRHLPQCASALQESSCCSYYPKATESLRMILKHCSSYTSVYWRNVGMSQYNQVAEYGIRIDFDIPVTTHCLQCQDNLRGGGTCGFDTRTENFLCLCEGKNVTSYCNDHGISGHSRTGVIAGTVTAVTAAGAIGVGAGIWFFKKVRAKAPVTSGVQTNENRLF